MIKILFVCLGNICRSPMAEFVLKDMVKKKNLQDMFYIASSATGNEEIGNSVHYGTKRKLREAGITCEGKRAVQLTKSDYDKYDYFIGMDSRNISNIKKIFGISGKDEKIYCLMDFTGRPGDIADPWYTGDFETTYRDVVEGCEGLLKRLEP